MARQTIEVGVVDKTAIALGKINKRLDRIEKNAKGVNNSFKAIAGIAGSVFAGLGLARVAGGVLDVSRRFEDLRAQLKTVTGSVKLANVAFGEIQKFAATTPFQVSEVVDSFIILKRFGIDATAESLKAFGNIAAANNKTFTQFSEAVADALTGEFERLKEFGIKVSKENGKFVARLGDQQLGVANSSTELINIIKALGEEGGRFGTGIEDRAATLSGALSNLNDASDAFNDAIGKEGGLNAALGELAGTVTTLIRDNLGLAKSIGESLANAVNFVNDLFTDFDGTIQGLSTTTKVLASLVGGAGLALAFKGLVVVLTATRKAFGRLTVAMAKNPFGLLAVAVASLITYLSMENGLGRTLFQVRAAFNFLGQVASDVAKFFRNQLGKVVDFLTGIFDGFIDSVIGGFNAIAEFIPGLEKIETTGENVRKSLVKFGDEALDYVATKAGDVKVAVEDSVNSFMSQNKTARMLYNTIQEAGYEYDIMTGKLVVVEDQLGNTSKALEENAQNAEDVQKAMGAASDGTIKLTEAQKKLQEKILETVNAITGEGFLEKYKELFKIREATLEEFNAKEIENEQTKQEQLYAIKEAFKNAEFDLIREQQKKIDDVVLKSIRRRAQEEGKASGEIVKIGEKKILQDIGNQEKLEKQTQDRIEFEKKSELEKVEFGLGQGAKFFQGLAAYNKKFFAAYKAFAIAQAIINTYQGATKALATYPPPFNFIAAAATVASGLAQVATIRAQTAQRGGNLITNQPAIVGEDGAEVIVPKQPSTVIPREVADAVSSLGGQGQGPVSVNFNINTVDASGFDELLVDRRATIVGIINQAMNSRGKQGVTV